MATAPTILNPRLEIESIAFGLVFQPRWKIIDHLGDVLDKVLYGNGTIFGPDRFPQQEVSGSTVRTLLNQETDSNDSFRFSERELLLKMDVRPRSVQTVRHIADHFQRFAVDEMVQAGLDSVIRYGFLIRLAECHNLLSVLPTEHYFTNDCPANSVDLRFTQRLPTQDAFVMKGVEGFCRLIYMVNQSEEGEVRFSIDYQQKFDPALRTDGIKRKKFTKFVEAGLKNYEGRFSDWLGRFLRSEAA